MTQFPDSIPEELRRLAELDKAGQLGDLPESIREVSAPKEGVDSGVTELFGSDGGNAGEAIVLILTQILERLDNLPSAIWDEVESR